MDTFSRALAPPVLRRTHSCGARVPGGDPSARAEGGGSTKSAGGRRGRAARDGERHWWRAVSRVGLQERSRCKRVGCRVWNRRKRGPCGRTADHRSLESGQTAGFLRGAAGMRRLHGEEWGMGSRARSTAKRRGLQAISYVHEAKGPDGKAGGRRRRRLRRKEAAALQVVVHHGAAIIFHHVSSLLKTRSFLKSPRRPG